MPIGGEHDNARPSPLEMGFRFDRTPTGYMLHEPRHSEAVSLTEADLRTMWDNLNARAYKPHTHVTWPNGTYCLDCGAPVRTT